MTSFLTDETHLPAFMLVRKEFLKEEDIYPANTLVIMKRLVPEQKMESKIQPNLE